MSILNNPQMVVDLGARDKVPEHLRGAVAIIGNLDGVHLGHQVLIDDGLMLAEDLKTRAAAVVFHPHPRSVFQADAAPFELTTLEQKAELLIRYGIETVFVLRFDELLMAQSPEEFVQRTLKDRLGLAGIVAGADFQFGKARAGTGPLLQDLSEKHGIKAHLTVPAAQDAKAEKYSSSQVRDAVRMGDMPLAEKILGRLWSIRGTVQEGKKLGRTIGFPTANISIGNILPPAAGVYAVEVATHDERLNGIANFGHRPTVDGSGLLLEVHLFNFNRSIYGDILDVDFVKMIRAEKKFDGLDALRNQISQDCEVAKVILEKRLLG